MQLAIHGDRYHADASVRQRPDFPEPPTPGRLTDTPVGRDRSTDARLSARCSPSARRSRVKSSKGSARPRRPAVIASSLETTARLRSAASPCLCTCRQSSDRHPILFVERASVHQALRKRPGLVSLPNLEGGDQIALVDEAVLNRQIAEEKVTFRSVYRHRSHTLLIIYRAPPLVLLGFRIWAAMSPEVNSQ